MRPSVPSPQHDQRRSVPAPSRIELNILSDPANLHSAREAVEQLCIANGFDARSVGEVGLCVNEALANVMRHAYRGETEKPIRIESSIEANQLTIRIRDWGTGENPAEVADEHHDPLKPGGLGLVCMRELMDETVYTPQPDGMLLTMVRRKV